MIDEESGDDAMSTEERYRAEPDGDGLPDLALHDVAEGAAFRIRSRALAELSSDQRAARSGTAPATRWYRRAIEPALLIGLGLGYCAWAAAGALAVLH